MALEKRVFQPSLLRVWVNSAVAAVFLLFFMGFLLIHPVGLLIYLTIVLLVAVVSYLGIKQTFVELKENGIQIKRGIIQKSQSLFLFSEMQDVNENQSFLDVILGLKSLSIKTMTYSSAVLGIIAGLRAEDAQAIRDYALENIERASVSKAKSKSLKEDKATVMMPENEKELVQNPWPLHFFKPVAIYFGFTIIISILLAVLWLAFPQSSVFWLIIIMVWAGLAFAVIRVGIQSISYNYFMGKTRLSIVQGIISFRRQSIPFSKVQDIIIRQSFFNKIIGLSSVFVDTGEAMVFDNSSERNSFLGNMVPFISLENAIEFRKRIFDYLRIGLIEKPVPLSKSIPLEKKKIMKESLRAIIGLGILFLIAIGLCATLQSLQQYLQLVTAIALAGMAIIIPLTIIFNYFYWKSYYYNFSSDAIIIRKGVFGVNEIVLPFERIQNVFVDQDFIDCALGLYDVHFSTVAWQSSFLCHIDGLNKENAEKIRDLIKNSIAN
ncbi:MAG: PH domain-containing protein [Candidatus Diapherotrites archaeon]|nr:PH domain-containing protein [Candidatus Diapherotrites archaeon]